MRILVVEDEKRIADFLTRGLQGAGYAVDAAPNGATALDFIHNADYDLVILDIMLPDLDGLKILEKIRNRKVGPPVLILSARGAVDDRVRGKLIQTVRGIGYMIEAPEKLPEKSEELPEERQV